MYMYNSLSSMQSLSYKKSVKKDSQFLQLTLGQLFENVHILGCFLLMRTHQIICLGWLVLLHTLLWDILIQ